jgi:hypothetical protein
MLLIPYSWCTLDWPILGKTLYLVSHSGITDNATTLPTRIGQSKMSCMCLVHDVIQLNSGSTWLPLFRVWRLINVSHPLHVFTSRLPNSGKNRVQVLLKLLPCDVRKYRSTTARQRAASRCQKKAVRIGLSCIRALIMFVSRHVTDPLVHHGHHFGRVVYAFCNVSALISNGLLRIGDLNGSMPDTSK